MPFKIGDLRFEPRYAENMWYEWRCAEKDRFAGGEYLTRALFMGLTRDMDGYMPNSSIGYLCYTEKADAFGALEESVKRLEVEI